MSSTFTVTGTATEIFIARQLGTRKPRVPPVAHAQPPERWQPWLIGIARNLNLATGGKLNATSQVTLEPGQSSTTFFDSRIGPLSHVALSPATANAGAASGVYVVPGQGQATVFHDVQGAPDRVFSVLIIG